MNKNTIYSELTTESIVRFRDAGDLSPAPRLGKTYRILHFIGCDADRVVLDDHPWRAPIGVPHYVLVDLLELA